MSKTKIFLFMGSILNCVDLSWGRCDPDVPSRRVPTEWASKMVKHCEAGTYLDLVDSQCKPCPQGYFITAAMARDASHGFCEKCYEVSSHEEVVENCTPSRDSVVSCQKGYFRRRDPSRPHCKCCWQCVRCALCVSAGDDTTYEKQSCSSSSDTVCCSKSEMVVKNNECVLPKTKHSASDLIVDTAEVNQMALEAAENSSVRTYKIHFSLFVFCYFITDVLEYFL